MRAYLQYLCATRRSIKASGAYFKASRMTRRNKVLSTSERVVPAARLRPGGGNSSFCLSSYFTDSMNSPSFHPSRYHIPHNPHHIAAPAKASTRHKTALLAAFRAIAKFFSGAGERNNIMITLHELNEALPNANPFYLYFLALLSDYTKPTHHHHGKNKK